jgi:hypothetical protein
VVDLLLEDAMLDRERERERDRGEEQARRHRVVREEDRMRQNWEEEARERWQRWGRKTGGEGGVQRARARRETMRERRDVDESKTLDVNWTVGKKGDRLRWNKDSGLMGINK